MAVRNVTFNTQGISIISGDNLILPYGTISGNDLTIDPINAQVSLTDMEINDPITIHVENGSLAPEPTDPISTEYIFRGWYTEPECINKFNFNTPITSDIILYAKWVDTFTVSFNANGHGVAPESQLVETGDKATRPVDPSEYGYTFHGWYTEAQCINEFDFNTPITSNRILYAKWVELPKYIFSFDMQGHGSAIPSVELYEGETVSRPADPSEVHFNFIDWYTDDDFTTLYDFSSRIYSNTIVYAKWEEVEKYVISYDAEYLLVPSKTIYQDEAITSEYLPTISKDPYRFDGWFYDTEHENPVEIGDFISGDITFYAKWLHRYRVSFDTKGKCFPPRDQIVEEESIIIRPNNPVADGWIFGGWYEDSKYSTPFDFSSPIVKNTTIHARWIIESGLREIDWTQSMQRTYEFYKVDPSSWKDSERIDYVESCTINWDLDADTLGSASFECSQVFDECYIRAYMIANQDNTDYKICLGTHLVQTPSEKFNGRRNVISMDGYTPLIELKGDSPIFGYCIRKRSEGSSEDTNIMDIAYRLCMQHMRAPVVQTLSDKTVYDNFLANADDTWFSFISDFIANAEYRFALDAYGKVMFEKNVNVDKLSPRWIYTDDNSSIIQPEITNERDLYAVPNVVEVVYSKDNEYAFARVENNDLSSPISIPNRGRPVLYRCTDPNISGLVGQDLQTYIDQYAKKLLKEMSVLEHKVTYTHGYCPVRIGDGVILNYRAAGYENVKAKVIAQSITCDSGCQVEETAVYTTNLWR